MKTRSLYPVILTIIAIGSVVSQNAEELPVNVETDNQFPPEHSELDGHNEGSETTTTEPTVVTSESTTEVTRSILTNEEQINGESKIEVSTEPTPEILVLDETATALVHDDDKVTHTEDTETTATDPNHITLGSTIPDVAVPTFITNVEKVSDKGSETTVLESIQDMSDTTKVDVDAQTMADEVSYNEGGETTAAETTVAGNTAAETTAAENFPTSESTTPDLAAPAPLNDGFTNDEGGETTAAETTVAEITAEESIAAETTPTAGSTTVDIAAPTLANDDFTNNKVGEATAAETTAVESALTSESNDGGETTAAETIASETTAAATTPTLGSTMADVAAPTLITQDEQETTNKDSETTVVDIPEPTSGSIIIDLAAPTLTTKDGQDTNNEVSMTTIVDPTEALKLQCPKPCVCITEGDSTNYIVDCSGYGLTELPTQIDPRTTTLKLHDNKLTIIPKSISELKNLKVLIANDNLITELEAGSISELPELVILQLANNRFLEYPKDLENSATWNKLEEMDLAGNELKTTSEIFSNYKVLRTVTLPEVSHELVSELCTSLKETLVTVCIKSCKERLFKCSELSGHIKDAATLPGIIPFIPEVVKEDIGKLNDKKITSETLQDLDAPVMSFNSVIERTDNTSPVQKTHETPPSPGKKVTSDIMLVPDISSNSKRKESSEVPPETQPPETSSGSKDNLPISDFSLRAAVNNAPQEKVATQNILIDTPKESTDNETDVKVGAKTIDTKGGGGVDKSVIAVIVAGMVIVIAVITVKKNWSSIRKRFSSTQRPNDRSGNANGTTPEEVPLQDKSPV